VSKFSPTLDSLIDCYKAMMTQCREPIGCQLTSGNPEADVGTSRDREDSSMTAVMWGVNPMISVSTDSRKTLTY
jgi:hypothetical protein